MVKQVKLKAILFEKGITQGVLAKRANVPRSYLSQYINGRFVFDDDQRNRIAKALKMDESKIFVNNEG